MWCGGRREIPRSCRAIEAAGVEAVVADPDVVSTLVPAFDHVTVVCILLGSATGSPDQLAALHGSRLEMLLTKLIDTTARGLVYEAAGTVDPEVLAGGVERPAYWRLRPAAGRLPRVAVLEADPGDAPASGGTRRSTALGRRPQPLACRAAGRSGRTDRTGSAPSRPRSAGRPRRMCRSGSAAPGGPAAGGGSRRGAASESSSTWPPRGRSRPFCPGSISPTNGYTA